MFETRYGWSPERPTLIGFLIDPWKVRSRNLLGMLLVDDDDELPGLPDEREPDLAARLGSGGLATIDATLLACTEKVQHKIARIISRALGAGGFPPEDDYIAVHARRLIGLANAGAVVIFGNPRRPRWSEARRSYEPELRH